MDDQTDKQLDTLKDATALKDALHDAQGAEQAAFHAMMDHPGPSITEARRNWDKARFAERDARIAVHNFLRDHPEAR